VQQEVCCVLEGGELCVPMPMCVCVIVCGYMCVHVCVCILYVCVHKVARKLACLYYPKFVHMIFKCVCTYVRLKEMHLAVQKGGFCLRSTIIP